MDEFRTCYNRGVEITRSLFPKANIFTYNEEQFEAAIDTIADFTKFHSQETDFLKKTVPLIKQNVSEEQLSVQCDEIFSIAHDFGINFISFPFLAALSCLYEDKNIAGYNASRELLHLKGGDYTSEKAYNALCDMRGLLFYFAFRAIAEQNNASPFAYCTSDKAALLFGCGLGVEKVEFQGNKFNMGLQLSEFLFPRLSKEGRKDLADRIQSI